MNEAPGKAGERPCRPFQRPTRGNRVGLRGSIPTFSAERQSVFANPCRLILLILDERHLRSVDLGSKAAETLRSASGGVPAASGEAAATSERSERKRHAVRSRGGRGRGAESAGWREVAEWCRATEGSGHE